MRLFIALVFDDQTKEAIIAASEPLRRSVTKGRFTERDNLHLTLVFLGEIAEERLVMLHSIIAATAIPPITLTFDSSGSFRRRKGGDIFWLGIAENPTLAAVQHNLEQELTHEGFELEDRPFRAHITLARSVAYTHTPDLSRIPSHPFSYKTDRIHLMQSTHEEGKLVYREI